MSLSRRQSPRTTERTALRLAAGLALALGLALPAAAAEEGPVEAANWTVFLTSGSSIAATEVHYDKNQGRYTLKLQKGGYIHLSPDAVRRVSRDTKDRVEKAEPVVVSSTGSPRAGAVPGAVDTSNVRPPAMRSATASISPEGQALSDRAKTRMRTAQGGEGVQDRRPVSDSRFTPKRGMMEKLIKQTNTAPKKSRR